MKLKKLRIRNFRCYEDVEIQIGSMHALVGGNNAGKSTVLKAMDLFFNPSRRKITEEWFYGKRTDVPIEIEGLFTDLTVQESEKLAACTRPDGSFHLRRSVSFVSAGDDEAEADEGSELKARIDQSYGKPVPKTDWLNPGKINGAAIGEWWKRKDELIINGESFAKSLGSKRPGVADWKSKAVEFARGHLTETDYEDAWLPNPQGYSNVLKATLPHFVLIPAVRDASDESRVTKTGPFGQLVYEILRGLDQPSRERIDTALKETTRLLNREGKENRAQGVTEVEGTIKSFLAEIMPADLELEFQAPTVEVLLTTPKIFIDDGFRGTVDGKGHGLQRAVIFSILRAYAKLVTRRDDEDGRVLVLAVEEPELYMHPTAQRTIRKVLRAIADDGDQVLFSTHSPLLVDVAYFDEIIRCENPVQAGEEADKVGRACRFQVSMEDMVADIVNRHPNLTGQVTPESIRDKYSHAYTLSRNEGFFANRVILVEGTTETYALPVYASALGHDLDSLSVAVIECGNKAQIDRLYRVFNELGIACYVVFDFDRNNSDPQRVRESKALLELLDASVDGAPVESTVAERYAYFADDWETTLSSEISDYRDLTERANEELGVRSDQKPLVARFMARRLAERTPPSVPPTVKAIIEASIKVERIGSCLQLAPLAESAAPAALGAQRSEVPDGLFPS